MSRPEFGPTASMDVAAPPVEAVPGHPCRIPVTVRNTGDEPTSVSLAVVGIDASWVALPAILEQLVPGGTAVFEVVVTVPLGHPAATLAASVVARDGAGYGATADLALAVTDGSVVAASMDPPEARGGRRGRTHLVLRNRSRVPVRVDLEPVAPERDLRIRVSAPTQVLAPGQEIRVATRFNAPRPLIGAPRRRPFGIRVRTPGTPLHVEGAFTQRPLFPGFMSKGVAIAVVVALWVAVAAVGIGSLSHHLNKSAAERAANNNPPAAAAAGPTGGSGTGSGGGSGGASGGGSGQAGGGSAQAGTSSGGNSSGGNSPAPTSRLSGKVSGSQPGGVTVRVTPTSLTDQAAQAATLTTSVTGGAPVELASASFRLGKLYGPDLPLSNPLRTSAPGVDSFSTTTNADGSWAIAAITTPGYYLVTFSKPGYSTASYVVNVASGGKPVVLQSRLVTGDGSLSGTATGPGGPLGGVQIAITDGTVELTTRTPTVGATGTWAVHGLTTPGTYLITATLPGYSIQTTLVTLTAGAQQQGIDLNMAPGEGSVSGSVVSASTSQPAGGLTVTASDASVTRTTTTTTAGAVGTYSLPDLPIPGTYALTVSGPGFVTQTQQVTLQAGAANATANATVTASTADVTGVATDANGHGLAGAGAVLANQSNVFKTLTTSSGTVGGFDFGQIPPGQYVLSVEDFGYLTRSAQVTVGPGQVQTVNLSLPSVPPTTIATATIEGSVQSLVNSKAISGVVIEIDGRAIATPTDSNGAYTITGVGPGAHTITATCQSSTSCLNAGSPGDFETTSVRVTVPQGGITFAPVILMPILDRLTGTVVDGTGAVVPNPYVTLLNTDTGQTYTSSPKPTNAPAPAAQGGFEFDGLPHGNYTLTATSAAPGSAGGSTTATGSNPLCGASGLYRTYTTNLTLAPNTNYTLTGGPGSANAQPVLAVGPVYRVATFVILEGTTTETPTPGVTVSISQPGAKGDLFQCTENTPTPTIQLPAGTGVTYTASFSYTSGTVTYTAPVSSDINAVVNSNRQDVAVLTAPLNLPPSGLEVDLQFPWRTPGGVVICPVAPAPSGDCPAVTQGMPAELDIVGQSAVPGETSTSLSIPASPRNPGSAGSGTWMLSADQLQQLQAGSVQFQIPPGQAGAFQALDQKTAIADLVSSKAAGKVSLLLTPKLVAVTGTLATPYTGTQIAVSPREAGQSVTYDGSGHLIWQGADPSATAGSVAPGLAYPGVYNVTFSRSGYDNLAVQGFQVPLCTTSCTATLGTATPYGSTPYPAVTAGTETYTPGVNPVQLTQLFELDVTLPGYTNTVPLASPTVTVTTASGQSIPAQTLTGPSYQATFKDLSVTDLSYTVTVSAQGYGSQTWTLLSPFSTDTCSGPTCERLTGTDARVAVSGQLTAESYFLVSVTGAINGTASPLAGASLTATLHPKSTCAAGSVTTAQPTSLSVEQYSVGSFLVYNPGPADGGVCPGSTYDLSASATGYGKSSVTATALTPGPNRVPVPLEANTLTQTFEFVNSATATGQPVPDVSVTATSTIGTPVATQSTGTGNRITVTVDPTSYNFTFTALGYPPLTETITYVPGEADQDLQVVLPFGTTNVTGSITTPGACGTPPGVCLLPGAQVTLTSTGPGSTVAPVTITESGGSYSFPDVPPGPYRLTVSLAGYQPATSSPLTFVASSPTIEKDVSMAATPVTLAVQVTGQGVSDLTGDSVALTPVSPTGTVTCSSALPAPGRGSSQSVSIAPAGTARSTGTARFTGVAPDFYQITVTGPGLPAQAPQNLLVCPGVDPATASYTVAASAITGTVTVPQGSPLSAVSISLTPTAAGGSALYPTVSCNGTSGCTGGAFSSGYIPQGGSYTLSVDDPGLCVTTVSINGGSAAAPPDCHGDVTVSADQSVVITLGFQPQAVDVTVLDATTGKPVAAGVAISLQDQAISTCYTAKTDSHGTAQFTGVQPDPSNNYAVLDGTCPGPTGGVQIGQIQVPVGGGSSSAVVGSVNRPTPTTTTTSTTTTTTPTAPTTTTPTTTTPTTTTPTTTGTPTTA